MSFSQVLKNLFSSKKKERPKRPIATEASPLDSLTVDQQLDLPLEAMVGKSNKFDFTNRSPSGVKLGKVICDSFRKEVPRVLNQARRHHERMQRQSAEGSSTGNSPFAASKDFGCRNIHLAASDKNLGDAGVQAMIPGMLDAINTSEVDSQICVEDINLAGNGLTVKALALLAPVIQACLHDLQVLNLANNNIRVVTPEEAYDFEIFLQSFRRCFKLQRLDLSGNKELGSKAYEVLARVYIREAAIEPLPLGGHISVHSIEYCDDLDDGEDASNTAQMNEDATQEDLKLAKATILKRRRGLRSLPYIDVTDTGLDDTGAMWLSYVLPLHYYPDQLIDELNATPLYTGIRAYHQEEYSAGLDWHNNEDTLGRDGLHLLCRAETMRRHHLHLCADKDRTSFDLERFDSGHESPIARVAHTFIKKSTPIHQPSISAAFDERTVPEINGARSKIQRYIMQHDGVHSVDLWHAAINLVTISRRVLILARLVVPGVKRRIPQLSDGAQEHPNTTTSILDDDKPDSPGEENNSSVKPSGNPVSSSMFERKKDEHIELPPPASGLTKALQKGNATSTTRQKYVEWQVQHLRKKLAKESVLPWVLPFDVFENIAGYLNCKHELSVMSERQRRRAYYFGQARKSLALEREWRKLNASAQLMMMLHNIQCLAYEAE